MRYICPVCTQRGADAPGRNPCCHRCDDGTVMVAIVAETPAPQPSPHAHYFKSVQHLSHVDVYRVCTLFGVTDPCLAHAIKKLLVAGGRGGKDQTQDVQEAIDSCTRFLEMQREDVPPSAVAMRPGAVVYVPDEEYPDPAYLARERNR